VKKVPKSSKLANNEKSRKVPKKVRIMENDPKVGAESPEIPAKKIAVEEKKHVESTKKIEDFSLLKKVSRRFLKGLNSLDSKLLVFWSKIGILVKSWNFGQKLGFLSNIGILVKHWDFGQTLGFW